MRMTSPSITGVFLISKAGNIKLTLSLSCTLSLSAVMTFASHDEFLVRRDDIHDGIPGHDHTTRGMNRKANNSSFFRRSYLCFFQEHPGCCILILQGCQLFLKPHSTLFSTSCKNSCLRRKSYLYSLIIILDLAILARSSLLFPLSSAITLSNSTTFSLGYQP